MWNEEVESIKQRILNEFSVVQEMKMKDREPLNRININKKAKAQIELGNLTIGSIVEKFPDLKKYDKVLHAAAKLMTESCSDSMKTTKKNPPKINLIPQIVFKFFKFKTSDNLVG